MTLRRRDFLKHSAALAPLVLSSSVLGLDAKVAPSNRLAVGLIGCGGKGMAHLKNFLAQADVQIVAVCDPDKLHYRDKEWGSGPQHGRDAAQKTVLAHVQKEAKGSGATCDSIADFRDLCARKDIDAVVVATPDHWHALCDLTAIRNGKDVYGEKPITHFFREGQQLVKEVADRGAIFQTGSQQRSMGEFRRAAELARNGVLGKVTRVEVGLEHGYNDPQGDPTVTQPRADLDYDLWTGPAPMLPYMRARHHRWWRGNLAYGGGNLMDWIGHHNDIAHWGLDMDQSGPTEVEAVGWTKPQTDVYNGPVQYEVVSRYPDGAIVSISSKNTSGVKFLGDQGWVYANRGKLEASNPEWITPEFTPGQIRLEKSNDHIRNFLDCVKSRKPCIAPAETGHRSITPGHLGYVSNALGRPVKWDAKAEKFVDDPAAEKLFEFEYREEWKLV